MIATGPTSTIWRTAQEGELAPLVPSGADADEATKKANTIFLARLSLAAEDRHSATLIFQEPQRSCRGSPRGCYRWQTPCRKPSSTILLSLRHETSRDAGRNSQQGPGSRPESVMFRLETEKPFVPGSDTALRPA